MTDVLRLLSISVGRHEMCCTVYSYYANLAKSVDVAHFLMRIFTKLLFSCTSFDVDVVNTS